VVTNVNGAGVSVTTSTGFVEARIDNSSFSGVGTGVTSGNHGFTTVSNSAFAGLMTTGASATGSGVLDVDTCIFTNIATGVSSAAGTQVRISNNSFYDNTTPLVVGGTVSSAGNNHIVGGTINNPNGSAYVLK
jgi:hypothetical protein